MAYRLLKDFAFYRYLPVSIYLSYDPPTGLHPVLATGIPIPIAQCSMRVVNSVNLQQQEFKQQ